MDPLDFPSEMGRIAEMGAALDAVTEDAARELSRVPPPSMGDDPAFSHVSRVLERQTAFLEAQTEFMREQVEAFRAYADESKESERRAWKWTMASLALAALSLLVAILSWLLPR